MSRSVTARSAVASVSTSGVFETAIPRALAASTSMLLKPTPKLATSFARRGSVASTSSVTLSVTVVSRASALRRASCRPSTVERPVLRIEARVELAGERLMHRLGEAAGHHHDRTRAHVPTVTRFDMPPSTRAVVLPRSAGLDTMVIPAPRMISTFSAALSPKARMIAPA